MIPCRNPNCDGTWTVCGKPSTHAYIINGSIPMNGSIPVTFINHVECRCDDHILTSFAGLEMAEISIDEAIIRQVLNS